jgi:predicted HicB family RNase H-like nuclease
MEICYYEIENLKKEYLKKNETRTKEINDIMIEVLEKKRETQLKEINDYAGKMKENLIKKIESLKKKIENLKKEFNESVSDYIKKKTKILIKEKR